MFFQQVIIILLKFLKPLSIVLQQIISSTPIIGRMAFCEAKRFLKNEVRLFVKFCQHVVRYGLWAWVRKTCFQVSMAAIHTIGRSP